METGLHALELGPAPQELKDYWKSEKWGLPYGDGWMNQPVGMVERMTVAGNTWNAVKDYRKARMAANWAVDNPEAWQIVSYVIKQI